jgi:PAS domain S-box-containing protein
LLIWFFGLGLIGIGARSLARMTKRLRQKNLDLENEIEERKAAQETLHEQALLLEDEIAQRQVSQEALQEQTVLLEEEVVERQLAQETLQEQTMALEEEIAERMQVEEALRVSEEKFSKAFDNAPIMITISGIDDGVYLNVNKKFVELSGLTVEEAVGKTSAELGLMTAEQRVRLIDELHRNKSISDLELQFTVRNGKKITCIVYGESILIAGKRCLLLLTHDVTEHRVMEGQLRQSQKMEAIGQLAGGIAHDFNNVLTVILGYSNILLLDSTLSQQQREKVEHLVSSSERASQLTRSLLTFSRRDPMELKLVDLNVIVEQLQKFLMRIIGEDVHLKVSLAARAMPVKADAGHIEQVLVNLAANGRDAMAKGGSLDISVAPVEFDQSHGTAHGGGAAGRYACITVSDTGEGMNEETRQRVFEPFFTTKETGKGTGLGMAIVHGIVKQHNGFVEIQSTPGLGTTVKIYLPESDNGERAQARRPFADALEGGTETVLVAEDDADVRALLHAVLTGRGYEVIIAENGQVAVDLFRANPEAVDLILLDMIMPGKNGQEALAEIRECRPDIKAIYLSGYAADFMKSRGISDQCVELLDKPFKSSDLLRKVRDTLDAIVGAP